MATEMHSVWAVVQTGAYTTDGVVVPFTTPDGQRVPAILFSHPDHQTCIRKRKRLLLIASRVRQLGQGSQSDMVIATPVLGVVPLTVELPKKQPRPAQTPSPVVEANGTPPVPTTPAEPPAEPAKRSRKHHESAAA